MTGGTRRHLPPYCALAALTLLAACSASSTVPSGRWFGTAVPNPPGPTCTASRAVATIHNGHVTFAPNEGTWVLYGEADPNGTLAASQSRLGADKKPYLTHLAATWTPNAIDGTYTTPGCTFTVQLRNPA